MYQGTLENNITQHWLIQGNAIVASFLTTYFANHTAFSCGAVSTVAEHGVYITGWSNTLCIVWLRSLNNQHCQCYLLLVSGVSSCVTVKMKAQGKFTLPSQVSPLTAVTPLK